MLFSPLGTLSKSLRVRTDDTDVLYGCALNSHQGLTDRKDDLSDNKHIFFRNERVNIVRHSAPQRVFLRDDSKVGVPGYNVGDGVGNGCLGKK